MLKLCINDLPINLRILSDLCFPEPISNQKLNQNKVIENKMPVKGEIRAFK